ncbi:hypothetical protein P3T18_001151 [Paraburkholderia sp. GAS199]|uniref:hypothetical protein n=1 Tax=Paraburkholderia sp. GAS199 TaxID=3035126 RepID=UPI003D218D16
MDQAGMQIIEAGPRTLARKSWTAYVSVVLFAFVGLRISSAVFGWSALAGIILLVAITGISGYRILEIRNVELYCDDAGVWLHSGVLPWNKGIRGVKWRDIEGAVFYQSMGSWLFKSYKLRIAHRFTRTSEILVSGMGRGNDAVETINRLHQQMIQSGSLN